MGYFIYIYLNFYQLIDEEVYFEDEIGKLMVVLIVFIEFFKYLIDFFFNDVRK